MKISEIALKACGNMIIKDDPEVYTDEEIESMVNMNSDKIQAGDLIIKIQVLRRSKAVKDVIVLKNYPSVQ